ncbi:MAG: ABC transporter ATP-binding protein [Candidatus Krumholzibacteriota bacterium]|nr:ABC transporter ATP-binding protein [Candidatus Krumholzibacteriota bacterium]
MNVLKAEDLSKVFDVEMGKIEVLKGLDFEAGEGEVIAILGESGAGKSTLLHLLGTLDTPDGGRVLIKGKDPVECGARELNMIRNRDIGFVFQFHYLLPEFNALENVMMPAVLRGSPDGQIEARARRLLEDVGLQERTSHKPAELSGGEQQRVAVARALMNEPAIILADEPSGNLDDRNSMVLHTLITKLSRSRNQTFVIVTHKKEILNSADKGFLLRDGKLFEAEKG